MHSLDPVCVRLCECKHVTYGQKCFKIAYCIPVLRELHGQVLQYLLHEGKQVPY